MAPGKTYTVVLADDHAVVRMGLRGALGPDGLLDDHALDIVGEAENGIEAIQLVKTHRPDLIVLDITMPLASGAEIVADIARWSPDTRIVVYSAVTSAGLLGSLVQAGIHGLFSKGADMSALFAALPLILRGGRHIEKRLVDLIRDATPPAELTGRERQALNMVLSGKSNAEIAALMGISPKTAEKHRASMMAKLDVRTLRELMAKAVQDGLIEQQGLL